MLTSYLRLQAKQRTENPGTSMRMRWVVVGGLTVLVIGTTVLSEFRRRRRRNTDQSGKALALLSACPFSPSRGKEINMSLPQLQTYSTLTDTSASLANGTQKVFEAVRSASLSLDVVVDLSVAFFDLQATSLKELQATSSQLTEASFLHRPNCLLLRPITDKIFALIDCHVFETSAWLSGHVVSALLLFYQRSRQCRLTHLCL